MSLSTRLAMLALLCAIGGAALALGLQQGLVPSAPAVSSLGQGPYILAATLGFGTIALAYLAGVRPLQHRILALQALASGVGKEGPLHYSPESDELGDVAGTLLRSHARLNADRALLKEQYETLRQGQAAFAHDVRTPLTALFMALEGARASALSGESSLDWVQQALTEALYVQSLFQNRLIEHKLGAGFAEHGRRAPFDLGQLVQRVEGRFAILSGSQGAEVHVARPDGPVCVVGEPTFVEQLVTNLVQNSLAHGGEHPVVVMQLEASANEFHLTVHDDGPGLSPELLHQIDHPAEGSRPGLGLSIARRVAEVHGWSIHFRNDEGLRVTLTGPVKEAE